MEFADAIVVLRRERPYAAPQCNDELGWRILSAPVRWKTSRPLTAWYRTLQEAIIKAAEDTKFNPSAQVRRPYNKR
jgi:hypothetical protein